MIEIGSKWQHKDGGVYEVIDYREQAFKSKNGFTDNDFCVWYKDKDGEIYVRTKKHFLASFKPYEPVYEYRWALKMQIGAESDVYDFGESGNFYTLCDPKPQHWVEYLPILSTKRERK